MGQGPLLPDILLAELPVEKWHNNDTTRNKPPTPFFPTFSHALKGADDKCLEYKLKTSVINEATARCLY